MARISDIAAAARLAIGSLIAGAPMAAAVDSDERPTSNPAAAGGAEILAEPDLETVKAWDFDRYKDAVTRASRGDLREAGRLCEALFRDGRVSACLNALAGVLGLPLSFESGDGEDVEKDEVIEALNGQHGDWWKMLPEDELGRVLKWGMLFGIGLAQKIWYFDDERGRWLMRFEVWSPKWLKYEKGIWKLETKEGTIEITPGDGQWFMFTPYGGTAPWDQAPWQEIALWWLFKFNARTNWDNYSNRQGGGLNVFTTAEKTTKANRKKIVTEFKNMGKNRVLAMPNGWSFDIVEGEARTYDSFERQLIFANTSISIALLGQNLTTEVRSGSLASARVHENVEARIIRTVSNQLGTETHEQVLTWYVALNWASQPVPWATWDTTPPENRKEKAQTFSLVGDFLQKASKAGFTVDPEQLAEQFPGVMLVKKEASTAGEGSTPDASVTTTEGN